MGMIETASRAICEAEGENPDTVLCSWKAPMYGARGYLVMPGNTETFPAWRTFTNQAEACLRAVGEPTDSVLKAGVEAMRDCCDYDPETQVRRIWRAMHLEMMLELYRDEKVKPP